MEKFYVTTPIYYVNATPHIGHAYTTIAADVLARYHQSIHHDVFFLTGTDEHGQKVFKAAKERGLDPKLHADELSANYRQLWPKLDCHPNAFIRTTDPDHKAEVRRLLTAIYDKGLVESRAYEGWYCTPCEKFCTEKEMDEDHHCPDCKRATEKLAERNYFFLMSRYGKALEEHILEHPDFIRPESRRNEVLGFLRKGLDDLCISRPKSRLEWGIPLPFDEDYVTYVWFDALINYISATRYLSPDQSRLSPEEAEKKWWPADVHLIGKDILTTHAVYWSTMLMALDLPLPKTIFAHGWWTAEGQKMSKSLGNFVNPEPFVNQYGVDAFRYFLLREVTFGLDGDFSQKALVNRINHDLANDLGNLMSRALKMVQSYWDGLVPEPPTQGGDQELAEAASAALQKYHHHMSSDLAFGKALDATWELVRRLNRYVDSKEPWALNRRGEREELATVLYSCLEGLRLVAAMIWPIMPNKARELCLSLGLEGHQVLDNLEWGQLATNKPIALGQSLFPRIQDDEKKRAVEDKATGAKGQKGHKEEKVEKQETTAAQEEQPSSAAQAGAAAQKAEKQTDGRADTSHPITYEAFMSTELRVGLIRESVRHPNADKLLVLKVDLGEQEPRTIVAGLAQSFQPEELLGRKVIVVANLKPAKLRGIQSQGMVLAVGEGPSGLKLATIEGEAAPGSRVR